MHLSIRRQRRSGIRDRSVVGLEKHAMLVGLMHRFEIWAEETWNQLEQQDLDQDAMPESVQSLSF